MVAELSSSYSSGSLPRFFFESRRHIGGVATVTWGSRLAALARSIPLHRRVRGSTVALVARMPAVSASIIGSLVGRACAPRLAPAKVFNE